MKVILCTVISNSKILYLMIKISDFGSLKKLNNTLQSTNSSINGTLISKSTDVFALGCTVYSIMTRHLPFEAANGLAMIPLILAGRYTPIEGQTYTGDLKALVYSMLDRNPSKRPTIAQLKAHKLLNPLFTTLSKQSSSPPAPSFFSPSPSSSSDTYAWASAPTFSVINSGGGVGVGVGVDVGKGVEIVSSGSDSSLSIGRGEEDTAIGIETDVTIFIREAALGHVDPAAYSSLDFKREFEGIVERKPMLSEVSFFLQSKRRLRK